MYLFDCTILASDALRPLADLWCHHAKTCLLRIGGVVRPLVAGAEAARLARSPGLRPAPLAVDEDGQPIDSSGSEDSDDASADS